MAVRKILKYPDAGLTKACAPVTDFGPDLKALADDLLDTMRAAPGVGITAAHIGVFTRLVVIELSRQQGPRFYVNPEVISYSGTTIIHSEGSVSMPGAVETIERPARISYRYQDLDGRLHQDEADGFHAVSIQHEIDQLDGIFWLRRLSRLKRDRVIRKWQKAG